MNAELPTQLLTAPREVDVVAIEREIARLWKEYGSEESESPITRACALNFIVVTEDETELDELANVAGEVSLEHPARMFLVAINPTREQAGLEAWISARCSLPVPGGKQVCCEQINIMARGREAANVPSIVTSLLVSDVPCVVLWKLPVDANDTVLTSLAAVANRILIDSSEDPSPEESLLAWETFSRDQDSHITFGDLAWTHLTAWRTAIANAFHTATMVEHLETVRSVEIEYSSTPAPRHSGISQSVLLVSWLAQKLRWTPMHTIERSELGEFSGVFSKEEHTINISIRPVPAREGFRGGIESVAVESLNGLALRWSTTVHRGCIHFEKHLDTVRVNEVQNIQGDKSEAALITEELEVVQRDKGYEANLRMLAEWLNTQGG